MPTINFLPVLVTAVVVFMLGGLWYSPVLFAKTWMALQGKTMEQVKASDTSHSLVSLVIAGLILSVWR